MPETLTILAGELKILEQVFENLSDLILNIRLVKSYMDSFLDHDNLEYSPALLNNAFEISGSLKVIHDGLLAQSEDLGFVTSKIRR